jgi:putative transcriptional regulator
VLVYIILLPATLYIIPSLAENPLRYGVALLPVIPIALAVIAYIRYLRRLDELQQRIQLEALALSVGVTGLLTFALGLLENVGGPQVSLVWVFPILIMSWAVGGVMNNRIRVLRAERNWSQAELAERLGVSRQTINAIESGKYDPGLPLAFKLARLFGQPIEAIFQPPQEDLNNPDGGAVD